MKIKLKSRHNLYVIISLIHRTTRGELEALEVVQRTGLSHLYLLYPFSYIKDKLDWSIARMERNVIEVLCTRVRIKNIR